MKRRTKQQWFELITKQQQSGLTAAEFCRNENITQKYFSLRKCKILKEYKTNAQVFTKINIANTSNQNTSLEYSYKNSTLKFEHLPNVKWLGELLKSLP